MGRTRSRRGPKKTFEAVNNNDSEPDTGFIPLEPIEDDVNLQSTELIRDNRSSFFGLLDRSELEYFKNAENILATNASNANEKELFISSVFVEVKGKELKIATNQVCSKLFERLVQLADGEQLLQLLEAFEPFAVDLAYQKFSSHCLEALLVKAIPLPSCEEAISSIAKRLANDSLDLAKDPYASHVLTTLVCGVSGLNINLRSKKSQLARKHTEIEDGAMRGRFQLSTLSDSSLTVAPKLRTLGRDVLIRMTEAFGKVEARKLAIDRVGSQVIQALVMSEAALTSNYKFLESIVLSDDSSGFITHCINDSVGSHFLEVAIKTLPAKMISGLIDKLPLAKMGSVDNEASSYLVQAIIAQSNLPKARRIELIRKDFKSAIGTNMIVSIAALDVDFEYVATLASDRMQSSSLDLRDTRLSGLFEKLSKSDAFYEKAVECLIAMPASDVEKFGTDPTTSYVLQALLRPSAPLIPRRKLLNKLFPHIVQFVVNAFGSHIVDSLWTACFKLKFARERIAEELLKMENQAKHSPYGRKIWQNWSMEKYSRKRHEWWIAVKAEEDKLREISEQGGAKNELGVSFRSTDSYSKRKRQA